MSKTSHCRPARSSSSPLCRSLVSGRVSRSSRKRTRRASTAAGVKRAAKATERRAAGQLLPVEQGHEWFGKRSQLFIEGFEGALATDGVALRGPPESRSPRTAQSGAVQSGHAHRWRQEPLVSVDARQEARLPPANRGVRGQTPKRSG